MRGRHQILAAAVAVALALPAAAALSPDLSGWADGPAGFLLTNKEQKTWNSITSDDAARDFIALFWARRDPKPDEPGNQFKAEFDRRVKYADDNFGTEDTRGALTDRGRVLILLGFPQKIDKRAPTETVERMGGEAGGTAGAGSEEVRANAQLWLYDPALLPAGLKVRGSQLIFLFYERKKGTNDFTLDRSSRYSPMALRVLGEAPEALLLHPNLQEVPKPVAIPGAQAATPAHRAWLGRTDLPFNGKLAVLATPGVADAVHRPLWIQLQLPADAPKLSLIAGEVKDGSGEVESTFELVPDALTLPGATAYQLSFPLLAGDYEVALAGGADGKPVFSTSVKASIPEIPGEGTWLSPLWTGSNVTQEAGKPMGSAFQFGPLHLVPDATGAVSKARDLSYFGYAVRPGVPPGGEPGLKVTIKIYRDGKRLGSPFTAPVRLAKIADDLWIYASSITLSGLPETGPYTLRFAVKDPVSGASHAQDVELNLTK